MRKTKGQYLTLSVHSSWELNKKKMIVVHNQCTLIVDRKQKKMIKDSSPQSVYTYCGKKTKKNDKR